MLIGGAPLVFRGKGRGMKRKRKRKGVAEPPSSEQWVATVKVWGWITTRQCPSSHKRGLAAQWTITLDVLNQWDTRKQVQLQKNTDWVISHFHAPVWEPIHLWEDAAQKSSWGAQWALLLWLIRPLIKASHYARTARLYSSGEQVLWSLALEMACQNATEMRKLWGRAFEDGFKRIRLARFAHSLL